MLIASNKRSFFMAYPSPFLHFVSPKKGKGNNLPVAAAVALPVTPYHERGKLIYKTSFTNVNPFSSPYRHTHIYSSGRILVDAILPSMVFLIASKTSV
jgi:hypothetical protein